MRLFAPLATALCLCSLSQSLAQDLWQFAREKASAHRFSTLFTAQDVRQQLSNPDGLRRALQWCKQTGVTKVYLETFRDGYQAEKETLENVKKTFADAKFIVSGCVTPTRVGKSSTGWKDTISCYTDRATQQRVHAIFDYTARFFDEVMIDDFWFTDCACPDCDTARKNKQVHIGEKTFKVAGDTWEDYRCELMVRLSQEYVLAAAKAANPRASLIIKYPQWYDRFHDRGYEVLRQTADFDRIWVGTETRDYQDPSWGGTPAYEAYFIMRWLGGIGGKKCGGGWYDPFGTTPATYLEQARQTVLAGAAESMLFCYGALQRATGPENILALRTQIPELLHVAGEVRSRKPIGIAAYKPANSHPQNEPRIFDFVGMMGLPLVPCHEFPAQAPAAFFSIHALKDPRFARQLKQFIRSGKPVLLTDSLAKALADELPKKAANVQILSVQGEPKTLLQMDDAAVNALREPLLRPLGTSFNGPNNVGLYLFEDGSWAVENFKDVPVTITLNQTAQEIPARAWKYSWKTR